MHSWLLNNMSVNSVAPLYVDFFQEILQLLLFVFLIFSSFSPKDLFIYFFVIVGGGLEERKGEREWVREKKRDVRETHWLPLHAPDQARESNLQPSAVQTENPLFKKSF